MNRFTKWFIAPKTQIMAWGIWTLVWLVLMPITLASGLKTSLEWVVFMSLFANCASTGTAWVAAMSYGRSKAVDDANLDAKLTEHHAAVSAKIKAHHEAVINLLDERLPDPEQDLLNDPE